MSFFLRVVKWNTPQTTLKTWCYLEVIETFRIVKAVIGSFYVLLVEEEENAVKLPHLNWIAFYMEEALPLYCEDLDVALVRTDCRETHDSIMEMIVSLFRTIDGQVRCKKTLDRLLSMARRLGYADVLWLYAARLINVRNRPVTVILSDNAKDNRITTDLLLNYLYTQRESLIRIPTLSCLFELRTTSLFRSIVSLLLRQNRRDTAIEAYLFMQKKHGIQNPLFYICDHAISIPNEYSAFTQALEASLIKC